MGSRVTVAILNWNGLSHLQTFLPSVVAHSAQACILLIDNASTDQSVPWVRENHKEVEIVLLPDNLGFTGGYNEGLKAVNTEFAVLLNSDVEVTSGWLTPLLDLISLRPEIAAVQPKIRSFAHRQQFEYAGASGGFIDLLGYPFCRGRIFDHCEADINQYDNPIPVFWATGACMMVRMEAYRKMGGLEPRFFAHMEEIDLCWRWLNAGMQVWVQPQSVVYHLGAGTLSKTSPRKTFLNFRNGLAMLYMNTAGPTVIWKMLVRMLLDGVAGAQFVLKGEGRNMWAIVRAHFSFYASWPYWTMRRANRRTDSQSITDQVIFRRSIVWDFFVRKRRTFSELKGRSD